MIDDPELSVGLVMFLIVALCVFVGSLAAVVIDDRSHRQ